MNVLEIEKYLVSGSLKSICISRSLLEDYHGFVRDLIICRENKLRVEYNNYGYDEGGLYITLSYGSQDALINSLETFLKAPLVEWENINKSGWYPEQPNDIDYEESSDSLKRDLFNDKILLPKGWLESSIPVGYWNDVANGVLKE